METPLIKKPVSGLQETFPYQSRGQERLTSSYSAHEAVVRFKSKIKLNQLSEVMQTEDMISCHMF